VNILERLRREPAVVIGAVAAVIIAAVQTSGGQNLLDGSVVDWITTALNPDPAALGWALPLILGLVVRFIRPPKP